MLKEQNGEVLGNIANYFSLLKDFLNGSNGSNIDISIDVS